MARPRRAVQRRISGRVLVSSLLITLTIAAVFAVWQMSDTEASVALPAGEESAVIDGTPTGPPPSPTKAPSPTIDSTTPAAPAATASASAQSVDWPSVVAGCRRLVQSRDTVVSRAATGIDHWSQHVQAQTDANGGKLSIDQMNKSFMRTRLLGPSDVGRYRDALDVASRRSGECSTPEEAPADIAATLQRCTNRLSAQRPVLQAGARGMHDWSSHLAAMKRSKQGHVHNAQQVWINTWRAAPGAIQAFDKASATFERAPTC